MIHYQVIVVSPRQLEPLDSVNHFEDLRVFVDLIAALVGIVLPNILLKFWFQVGLLLLVVLYVLLVDVHVGWWCCFL